MIGFREFYGELLLEGKFKPRKPNQKEHVVIAFGRFGVPTEDGHGAVVKEMHTQAALHNADHRLIASGSTGDERNPLLPAQKLKHLQRAFPKTNISVVGVNSKEPNIIEIAKGLNKEGYKHLHFVGGTDRMTGENSIIGILKKYNGKRGSYNFKSITGHEVPRGKGAVSASSMREMAKKGDFLGFMKGISKNISGNVEHARELFVDVRSGLKHLKKVKKT